MRVAIADARPDPVTPYRYIGGDPSVDFVNTADWTVGGLDRFCSYDRIVDWAAGADVIAGNAADALRAQARAEPARAARTLADAVTLRGLLEQVFFDVAGGHAADRELAELNQRWLGDYVPPRVVVSSGAGTFTLGWPHAAQSLEAPLWSVIWAVAQLLASPDVTHLKRCGGIDCGWYYIDRSRNGLRRWCEMETCGTMMKSYRRRQRSAASRSAHESPNRSSPSR